jgi:osmoprotectant transport system permease protein
LRVVVALLLVSATAAAEVKVGSKAFTESVILGEIAVQTLEARGIEATHRRQLGGTQVLWKALVAGEIDAYPEYTGTLREEIFARRQGALEDMLAGEGVVIGAKLGFEDTYALGMREEAAAGAGVARISDLRAHPGLRLVFSNEFMSRGDGWPALRAAYGLPHEPRGMDHDLAYRALAAGEIDVTDLYSTDAEIRAYRLRVLEDDRRHFPPYEAVLLHRRGLDPRAARELAALAGRIEVQAMIAMNARVKLDRVAEAQVAADFLGQAAQVEESRASRILAATRDHLFLVGVSLLLSLIVALPLGILAARRPRLGAVLLSAAGVVQTIPSLALLVFMIPFFGIGATPAIVALFLYGLLPIVRNTHAGISDVPPSLLEAADAIGLEPRARLRLVELPLAARSILAGVKTSAVINVGTATLGALIGAGGYGQAILTGIRLDDVGLILEGAIPAAALALLVQGAFDVVERFAVPRALRPARGLQNPEG